MDFSNSIFDILIKPSSAWISGIEKASISNNSISEQLTCLQAQLQKDWHSVLILESCNTWESPLEVDQCHPNRAVKIVNVLFIIGSEKANDFLFLVPSLPFSGSWPSTCFSPVYAVALSLIRCRLWGVLLWNWTLVIPKQVLIKLLTEVFGNVFLTFDKYKKSWISLKTVHNF